MKCEHSPALSIILALVGICFVGMVGAQNVGGPDPYNNQRIEAVLVRITNPSSDSGLNDRVEDGVRRAVSLFPGARFSQQQLDFQLTKARRVADVGAVDYDISFGRRGGLDITLKVTLGETATPEGRGMVFGGDFPTIYEKDGTFVRFKLDLFGLYYANDNAWYGRPDLLLAGNPLVEGTPSGSGFDPWLEGYLHYGIYGITPLNDELYAYAGLSAITSGSWGQEIFTDKTRSYTGVEDAYVGLIGGRTDAAGDRFAYNLTAGRQRFTLANGFLLATTSANGHDRAALQANARWASDFLGLARFHYNNTVFEAFYLDPDELPLLDTGSTFAGVNLEFEPLQNLKVGISYLTSPDSEFNYFGPTGSVVGTREGLRVWDARFSYTPNGPAASGPFFGAEFARQTNENFDMDARAGWAEIGYSFPQAAWSPTISYRYAHFTGDDPDTATYERWDPLLSGLSGEAWIQSANHFKVVQNSNLISHRLQARLRPSPKVELVPQLWAFYADSKTNVGGNPALTFLSDREYGFESMVTAKWFVNRNLYVHGHVAYTWPGDAVDAPTANDADGWLSTMLFVRYSF